MRCRRKAQLTVFIIIGIVILIAAVLLIMLTRPDMNGTVDGEDEKVIRQIVEDCVQVTTDNAIMWMSLQGGMLYLSQGGLTADPQKSQGIDADFIDHTVNGVHVKVPYLITETRITIGDWFTYELPAYPWSYFPYIDNTAYESVFFGPQYGNSELRYLNQGPNSMQKELESYIAVNAGKCAVDEFSKIGHTYEIEPGSARAIVTLNKTVLVDLELPVSAKNKRTGNSFNVVSKYVYSPQIRMREIYQTALFVIESEMHEINYTLDPTIQLNGMAVLVDKGAGGEGDLYIIEDKRSMIQGEALKFMFGVKNRPPALTYIREDLLPVLECGDRLSFDETNLLMVTREGNQIYNWKRDQAVLAGDVILKSAYDPDDDKLSISWDLISNPYTIGPGYDQQPIYVKATDGYFNDSQRVELNVRDCG